MVKSQVFEKVITVAVCYKKPVHTNGSTVTTRYIELDLPETVHLGPKLLNIVAHTYTEDITTQFLWNFVHWSSTDGKFWRGPFNIFALINATTVGTTPDAIQSAYNTSANFGIHMRYAIACINNSGNVLESAVVTGVLAFNFLT